jgi:hypothetical protein
MITIFTTFTIVVIVYYFWYHTSGSDGSCSVWLLIQLWCWNTKAPQPWKMLPVVQMHPVCGVWSIAKWSLLRNRLHFDLCHPHQKFQEENSHCLPVIDPGIATVGLRTICTRPLQTPKTTNAFANEFVSAKLEMTTQWWRNEERCHPQSTNRDTGHLSKCNHPHAKALRKVYDDDTLTQHARSKRKKEVDGTQSNLKCKYITLYIEDNGIKVYLI